MSIPQGSEKVNNFYVGLKETLALYKRQIAPKVKEVDSLSGGFVRLKEVGAAANSTSQLFTRLSHKDIVAGDRVLVGYLEDGEAIILGRVHVSGEVETLAAHVHPAADVTSGVLATARLATGTASSTTFARGDGTWAVPAAGGSSLPIVSPVVPGRYYSPTGMLGIQATLNVAPITNNAYCVPVMFDRDGTIDQIGLSVAGAGPTGSTIRMTIYSAGSTNRPGARLLTTSPAAVSLATAGIKTFSISQAVTKNVIYYLTVAAIFASAGASLQSANPARDWYGTETAGEYSRFGTYTFTQTEGWTEFPANAGDAIVPYPAQIFLLSARLV